MIKLWYKEKFVLTTEQVADILGTTPKSIQMNFKNNTKRYVEGKHYFSLKGAELKQFKALTNNMMVSSEQLTVKLTPGLEQLTQKNTVSSLKLVEVTDSAEINVPMLMLWTRKGLLRHVKSVNTDEAWELFDRMEEVYFNVLEQNEPEALAKPEEYYTLKGKKVWTLKQAAEMFRCSTKQIQKALYGRRFERGKDYFVADQRQMEELSAENGQWFNRLLTLILESGLTKLRRRFEVKAAANETLKELRAKAEELLKAALDMNVFMVERRLIAT